MCRGRCLPRTVLLIVSEELKVLTNSKYVEPDLPYLLHNNLVQIVLKILQVEGREYAFHIFYIIAFYKPILH